jgi:CRP-like cAMP-binding protein
VDTPETITCTPDDLREIGLFGALPDDALGFLCETLKVVDVAPGDMVFREGDHGRDLYVVLSGELEVLKRAKSGHDARVAVLGIHDWFGEMSVLDVQPRSASVRAVAPGRLLHVTSSDLDALYRRDLKSYALVVLNVARELSRRLRVADGILAELVLQVTDAYMRKLLRHRRRGRRARRRRRARLGRRRVHVAVGRATPLGLLRAAGPSTRRQQRDGDDERGGEHAAPSELSMPFGFHFVIVARKKPAPWVVSRAWARGRRRSCVTWCRSVRRR